MKTLSISKFVFILLTSFIASALVISPAAADFSESQLRELSEPVALYPDQLLFQMLPAATFPDQIVDAGLLIKSESDAKAIEKQSWDASVKTIANYPGVLKYMNDNLNWTKDIGVAFLNQNEALLDTIQSLRKDAQQVGNLKSDDKQTVKSENAPNGNTVVVIEPADPEVIYVPTTTTVVYTEPSNPPSYVAPLVTFGLGFALGSALNDNDYYYYGGPGIWYDHRRYDRWVDRRWDHIDDRREFRQDRFEEQQDFRNDRVKDRQDFRQDQAKNLKENRGNFSRASTLDRSNWNKSYEDLKKRRTESGRSLTADRGWDSAKAKSAAQSRSLSKPSSSSAARSSASQRINSARSSSSRSVSRNTSAFKGYSRKSSTNAFRSRGSVSRSRGGFSGGGRRGGGGGFRRRG